MPPYKFWQIIKSIKKIPICFLYSNKQHLMHCRYSPNIPTKQLSRFCHQLTFDRYTFVSGRIIVVTQQRTELPGPSHTSADLCKSTYFMPSFIEHINTKCSRSIRMSTLLASHSAKKKKKTWNVFCFYLSSITVKSMFYCFLFDVGSCS